MVKIDPEKFALSVVTGYSVNGLSYERVAEEALKLYLAAYEIAEKQKEANQEDWLH